MLPMDLAWRLLKMSEAEMREAGYLDYYSPENIANYYQKRRMRYGSRLPSNLRNEIISEQLARGNRMLAAGIPEELMYAHHDYPPLLEARMNVPERKLHLLPYEADERSQIADLEDVASKIDMNPRAVYNNQRLFRQMIPENFAMEEPEIEQEQIIEESPIPGMVFINGVLSVDPRNQKSEPMDIAMRLLKRQTELGEFHPDLPSSHGPVKYYHGTPETNVQQIMRQGLRANKKLKDTYKNIEEYFQAVEDGSHDKLMENYNPTYRGAFVTTKPERALFYGDHDARYPSALIGIREGAGMPEEYIGYGDDTGEDTKRLFPDDYRFMDDVDPKFLTQIKEGM
jgi:hypothetical protein